MRNISFFHTQGQIMRRTKNTTRRLWPAWRNLRPGRLLCGVAKSQGRKPGEPLQRLAIIRVVHVCRERLWSIRMAPPGETAREGFPEMSADDFIDFFCKAMGCQPDSFVNRIVFEYVELKMFFNGVDFVVAHCAEYARKYAVEFYGCQPDEVERFVPYARKSFTLHDGNPNAGVAKSPAQWAIENGPGYFACTEY